MVIFDADTISSSQIVNISHHRIFLSSQHHKHHQHNILSTVIPFTIIFPTTKSMTVSTANQGWATTSTTTTYTPSYNNDSIPVRTLSVRRNAQSINVLVSHKTPKQYPEMMQQLTYVTRHLKQTVGKYNCLEVGAREGRLLRCWPMGEAPLPFEYVGLERNPKYNDLLRQSMKDKQLTGSIIHSRRPPNEIENLTGRPEPFDLIIFSHSLYWESDHAARIVHESIQSLLHKDHGICLIFHHAFGFYSLWHLMERRFARNEPLHVQPHSAGSSAVQLIAALQQIQKEEQQEQIGDDDEPQQYTPMVAAIDPCSLFLNGLTDYQWNEFLSFIFQLEASELPDDIRQEAIQLVLGTATQTSESTNGLSSSLSSLSHGHQHHQNTSAHTRTSTRSVDSTNSSYSSSHYTKIDGTTQARSSLLQHDSKYEYWLHHPHVTIKITTTQQQQQQQLE